MRKGNFGARIIALGQTQFRFWAPNCAAISVVFDDGRTVPMLRSEDDVFEVIIQCDAGTNYKYKISETLVVPDPASRMQNGDVHEGSAVISQDYNWTHAAWQGRPWHESVIYELHAGVFGGFKGVKKQLPRLARLGITAIELMPIADFPGQRNWGYDGVLPYAPDAAYGTPDELKSLIDAAHGLGLQVFLDVVYNHFGPDGNYLNAYAKEFFRDDVHTAWGNAIDFRRPQVKRFFIENALYWLNDFRFDGLRFDAVHAIEDNGFLLEMAAEIRHVIPGRHVHLILENENNEAALLRATPAEQKYDAQWTDDWHHCLHVLLTGEDEGYYRDFQNAAESLARCLAEGFTYQGEPSAHAGGAPRGSNSAHLPSTAFVICLQNHDQIGNRALGERLTVLANPEALRAAVMLLLFTPQIPMLFMGEERGSQNPFLFFTDHHDELADAVREGRRKEFAHFAAFSEPDKRAAIPDPNAPATFHASVPKEADPAVTAFYEKYLSVRAVYVTPHLPGAKNLEAKALSTAGVRAAWRLGDGSILTIASNFSQDALECAAGAGSLIASTSTVAFADNKIPAFSTYVWQQQA